MVTVAETVLDLLHLPAQRHHHHGLGEPLPRHLKFRLVSENVLLQFHEKRKTDVDVFDALQLISVVYTFVTEFV